MSSEKAVLVLHVSLFVFLLVEVIHVELNDERVTCLWKEVRLECLK